MRGHGRRPALLGGALVAAAALAAVTFGSGAAATATPLAPARAAVKPPPAALAFQQAIVRVVRALSPSVVQIQDASGLGSGIVFDAKGDIVTNNHVVAGARTLTVTTAKGKRYKATLVGAFAPDDLAVIHVSGANLKPATFANSSKLAVGDLAIAIGNPLGLRSSVTEGIVSAFRQGVSEGTNSQGQPTALPSMIQTSAAINPGNSGGALADIEGRVIGIPTLAATDPQLGGGSAPGIGFAIPSNLVRDTASQIITHGHVVDSHRAYLGVEGGDTNGQGVYVGVVLPGGPAAKAGLQAGEVIVAVAGQQTPTLDQLTTVLSKLKPGRTVAVKLLRQDGTTATLRVTLGTVPGGS